MEIQEAIDRLDDHLHLAPEIPLTDQVRIEEELLRASVGVIRHHADRIWGADRRGPVGELVEALEEVEAMVASAKSVPATNQVRVNRDKLYEPLDRIRALLAKAAVRAGGASSPWAPVVEAVEGIDGLMNDAGHAQGEGTLELSVGELHGLLDRMRTAGHDGAG